MVSMTDESTGANAAPEKNETAQGGGVALKEGGDRPARSPVYAMFEEIDASTADAEETHPGSATMGALLEDTSHTVATFEEGQIIRVIVTRAKTSMP